MFPSGLLTLVLRETRTRARSSPVARRTRATRGTRTSGRARAFTRGAGISSPSGILRLLGVLLTIALAIRHGGKPDEIQSKGLKHLIQPRIGLLPDRLSIGRLSLHYEGPVSISRGRIQVMIINARIQLGGALLPTVSKL